jgi:hypothetical protein
LTQFIYCFGHCLLIEVDQTHVLLKVFELLIDSLLLHLEALVVLQFILSPLILNLINEFLILAIHQLDVFDPSDFHLLE